jgi:hypothetical protein
MSPEQGAAYVQAMVACSLIECEAMKAENYRCEQAGLPHRYKYEDFMGLLDKYGIHYNSIHEYIFRTG